MTDATAEGWHYSTVRDGLKTNMNIPTPTTTINTQDKPSEKISIRETCAQIDDGRMCRKNILKRAIWLPIQAFGCITW